MENIICMKWGAKYSADYVNILAEMVRRNMSRPYRFVCFTENSSGLKSDIEVRPLPEMNLAEHLPERGWRKLTVLAEKLADLEGRALFLDLDIVILGSLEPFFEVSGKFRIIHDWDFKRKSIGNSSVFRFEIGQHSDILEHFLTHGKSVRAEYRNEQAYLSHAMQAKGILEYWSEEWCRSFKRHCLLPFPLNYFAKPRQPANAKIIIFHGNPNPDTAIRGYVGKYGFRAVLPTSWVAEHWKE
ncbi:MAG: hypothetical protein LBT05_11135 [Planctomycetaceae bacterium]|jgi:hypothetical protein|nr:hypothetical protein [Planctomycetaceae bacterium]